MSTDVPETMKVAVLRAPGEIAIEERRVPTPKGKEVLIRIGSVGVCGSDVHYYDTGRIGNFVVEQPLVLGHEAGGVIVAVGEDVDPSRIGERVSIEPQKACRECEYCKRGEYNLCPDIEFYATPPIDGAFQEYAIIEDDFAHRIQDSISDNAAALMEPLSVAIAAVQKAKVKLGDTVLIAGAGPIGVITSQVAKAFGAQTVIVTDVSETRRNLAKQYGADETFAPDDPRLAEVEAHSFIDASGAPSAIQAGLSLTRPGGVVVLVGAADEVPLSVSEIGLREVNVTGIFRYNNTWPLAIQLVLDGKVDLDSLVTDTYGLEEVDAALSDAASPGGMKRVVLPAVARVQVEEKPTRGEAGPR